MSEYFTTEELAGFLRVKSRKVYDLVSKDQVPYSRVMGKLLFSKKEIKNWISGEKNEIANNKIAPDVILGSHDPLLELAIKQSKSGIAMSFDGSTEGLERFNLNQGIASGLHIYDEDSKNWNTPIVHQYLKKQDFVLMEWAKRERGLIFKTKTDKNKKSINDFVGHRLVTRQPGSGSDNYIKYLFKSHNISFSDFISTEIAYSENDAVLLILSEQADVTLGLECEAKKYKLEFIPIVTERFDLIVDRLCWFEKPFQKLLNFCRTEEFFETASKLNGYNINNLGTVHYNSK